jgi:hypothetical protein
MHEMTTERWGAATGFAALAAGAVGGALEPGFPSTDDAAVIADFVADHRGALLAQSMLFVISAGIFLWFVGSLRSFLLRAEGATGRLSGVAFGAGIAWAGASMAGQAPQITQALTSEAGRQPDLVATMGDLGFAMITISNLPLAVMLAAVAVLSFRKNAFPSWVGWLSVVAAVGYLVLSFGIVVDSGPLAPTGWLTYTLYPVFALWLIPATTVMIARIGTTVPVTVIPDAPEEGLIDRTGADGPM